MILDDSDQDPGSKVELLVGLVLSVLFVVPSLGLSSDGGTTAFFAPEWDRLEDQDSPGENLYKT